MPALRRISAELELPEPTRSRILLEMASDLEALYEHYRALELGEDEAARRAEAKLLASPEALRHLIEVHTTGYHRLVTRVAGRLRWGFDLFLFVVGVAPLVLVSAMVVATHGRLSDGGLLLPVLLAIGAAIVGLGAWKGIQLFVQRERSTAALNRGLFGMLFLGAVGSLLGLIGALVSVYRMSIELGTGAGDALQVIAAEVIAGGTLFTLGTLLGIAAATLWFVFVNRVTAIEQAESSAILGA